MFNLTVVSVVVPAILLASTTPYLDMNSDHAPALLYLSNSIYVYVSGVITPELSEDASGITIELLTP